MASDLSPRARAGARPRARLVAIESRELTTGTIPNQGTMGVIPGSGCPGRGPRGCLADPSLATSGQARILCISLRILCISLRILREIQRISLSPKREIEGFLYLSLRRYRDSSLLSGVVLGNGHFDPFSGVPGQDPLGPPDDPFWTHFGTPILAPRGQIWLPCSRRGGQEGSKRGSKMDPFLDPPRDPPGIPFLTGFGWSTQYLLCLFGYLLNLT